MNKVQVLFCVGFSFVAGNLFNALLTNQPSLNKTIPNKSSDTSKQPIISSEEFQKYAALELRYQDCKKQLAAEAHRSSLSQKDQRLAEQTSTQLKQNNTELETQLAEKTYDLEEVMGQGPIAFDTSVDPKALQNKLSEDFSQALDDPNQLKAIDCTEQPCIAHIEVDLDSEGISGITTYLQSIAGTILEQNAFQQGLSFQLDTSAARTGAETMRVSFVINSDRRDAIEKNRTAYRIDRFREASEVETND